MIRSTEALASSKLERGLLAARHRCVDSVASRSWSFFLERQSLRSAYL